MEEMTIVRFFVDKEKKGKEKRRAEWQYYLTSRRLRAGKEDIILLDVVLPGVAYKKKEWSAKSLAEYLEGLPVPPEGRHTYYLCEGEAEAYLGRGNEILSVEWVLWLIRNCRISFDSLVLFWDRETQNGELLEQYVRNTRYIGVVTENEEYALRWQDMLWEEYGFLLETVKEASQLHIPNQGKKLIVAGEELYGLSPGILSGETTFISTQTGGGGKSVCARAQDTKYIDIKCFLESLLP